MRRSFFIVFLVVLSFSISGFQLINAQGDSEVTVIPQQFDDQKLVNLQNTYLGQLELYRNQEQNYVVARNQYHKLNTLASQELAVAETRQLLSLRADILITYIDILNEQLAQAKGIPLENKSPEKVSIELLREKVQLHKSSVQSAQDRFAVDAESANFLGTYREIQSHTYYILSLIKLGSMQIAYDKLLLTKQAVQKFVMAQPLSTAVRAEKERGFAEIDRNISNIDLTFKPIKTKVYKTQSTKSLSGYSLLTTELNPVYGQINQVIQFLEEIRK